MSRRLDRLRPLSSHGGGAPRPSHAAVLTADGRLHCCSGACPGWRSRPRMAATSNALEARAPIG